MVKAIDIHAHVYTADRATERRKSFEDAKKYFKSTLVENTIDETAEYYRERDMMAVIFDVDAESQTGLRISNDEVAAAVQKHPDVFIGFCSVDPWKGKAAIKEVERCVKELGLRGVKFMQATMAFYPNDTRFYPLWEKIAELGVPALFHMGTTGIGAGAPGGRGIKLKYCKPIPYIDDVAADFPELKIICAHPAWPWHSEMLAVARHKANVYMDLSGWAPKYFPPEVVHYANSLLQDKVLFGSDYPLISPDRWLKEFAELNLKEEVRPKILLHNAAKLLGIDLGGQEEQAS